MMARDSLVPAAPNDEQLNVEDPEQGPAVRLQRLRILRQ